RIRFQVKNKTGLIWELTEGEIRSAFPMPPSANPKPTSERDPYDKLPPDLQKVRLWLEVRLWEHREESEYGGPEELLSWRKEFLTEFDSKDASKQPPLGSLRGCDIEQRGLARVCAPLTRRSRTAPRLPQFEHIAHHRYRQRS